MTRVAIQGVTGSYSEEAAREIFGGDATIVECHDFEATFAAVDSGTVNNAVIPIENKIVGPISRAVDLLKSRPYTVLEKMPLKVRHVIAGTRGARFEDLVSIRSHVEALKQCRTFLAAYPNLRQIVGADTASSIRRIVDEGDPAYAAIGSRRAADMYGAEIIRENIADDIDNWTVFYVIGN